MNLDWYSRVLLSIIAVCLVLLTFRFVALPAHAAPGTTPGISCNGTVKPTAYAATTGNYDVLLFCNPH